MSKKRAAKKTRVVVRLTRRDFLVMAGTAGGSVIAAQALTTGPLSPFAGLRQAQISGEALSSASAGRQHWGMTIDLSRCIGCEYCIRACNAVNDVRAEAPWNIVVREQTTTGRSFFFSRPCLHCQHAPCVEVCPVEATFVRPDGLVVMDYDRCIGCRYCEVACPYDARRFNWEARQDENTFVPTWGVPEVERRPRGVVEKCTFCIQRIDAGLEAGLTPGVDLAATPACVNICPVAARAFGDLNDPESPVARLISSHPTMRLRQELGTEPSVYYIPPDEETHS